MVRLFSKSSSKSVVDDIVKNYGDLLFDLCESVLWNPINAQLAFRSILKTVSKTRASQEFRDHERAWILRIACERLRKDSSRLGRRLTPSEQIELDSAQGATTRLRRFDSYFHRLNPEDQLLLLLRDKYGVPYVEISAAMGAPEGSLKVRRQQALRALEDWIWQ
ncbi:MAG: sigma factor-like helix-turn-helix DNA-binding protein [Oligoflexia bacterium]|nr:sigma factor-like helix-turn-helix DNA-binding protein [Oligoflexia bacterium]